jgi:hypothetical protein
MAADLQWNDAMLACAASFAFKGEEKTTAWPADMTPGQLAAMQRPFVYGHRQGRERYEALRNALNTDVAAGGLPAAATSVERHRRDFVIHSLPMDGSYAPPPPPPSERTWQVTIYRVTPKAFAAWLRAQGEEPSVHVERWFLKRGVAWLTVVAAVPDGPMPYLELIKERNSTDPPPWTERSRASLRAEVDRAAALGERSHRRRIGEQLRISEQRVGELYRQKELGMRDTARKKSA